MVLLSSPDKKDFLLKVTNFLSTWFFYNRLLQCFVIIEIKTTKLSHQDIGQRQMYVNYYDRFEKRDFENPTIGILLCADKNNAVVKISLPENNKTIIASEYKLYLPSEKQLIEEMNKEIKNYRKMNNACRLSVLASPSK
jgi:hypothetical protein